MEGTVNLPLDLQCGDIFHLFALVSSGEFSILPVLPVEGVGEAEDSRNAKRKYDDREFDESGMNKSHKYNSLQESEMFSRREKGFPGIKVSLSRRTILTSSTVEFFKDDDKEILLSKNDQFYAILGQKVNSRISSVDSVPESPDFGSIIPSTVISGDSVWEVITNYMIQDLAKHGNQECIQLHPDLIKSTYKNIQKAGDQGLSMSKISECLGVEDIILAEHVVDALQLFGLVLKATCSRDPEVASSSDPQRNETQIFEEDASCQHERNHIDEGQTHSLNHSKEPSLLSNAVQAHEKFEGCSNIRKSARGRKENQDLDESAATFQPILPWINGDGTVNVIVYRGLTRRVLGIVTQNPGILEGDHKGVGRGGWLVEVPYLNCDFESLQCYIATSYLMAFIKDNILRQMEVLNPQTWEEEVANGEDDACSLAGKKER
ncbi:Glutamate-1-semialdehyde 2 1-aminomutase [Bienertia sinuspersici]